MQLTLITSKTPERLSKGFKLDEAGKLLKMSGGAMQTGTAKRVELQKFSDLATILTSLNSAQALCYGISPHKNAIVLTKKALKYAKQNGGPPVIARDREHFRYPSGTSLMMFDNDPAKDQIPLTGDEFLEAVYSVCPEISKAPHVLITSASSYIYMGNECLKGPGGWRLLVAVKQGTDIQRAGEAFFKRCWLLGKGHIFISKSGAMLPRTIIDAAVWQPERLDFCAGASCKTPLEQRRPAPQVFNPAGVPLNSTETLKPMTLTEENEFKRLKGEAIKAAHPEANKIQDQWVNDRVQDGLSNVPEDKKEATGRTLREAYTSAVKNLVLLGDFLLVQPNGKPVTVGEVLDNPDKWHGKRFADPLEPDYGNDKRISIVNLRAAGRPYIYSHAHGGRRFPLHRARVTIELVEGERVRIVKSVLELMRINGAHYRRGGEIVSVNAEGEVIPRDKDGLLFDVDGLGRFERFDRRSSESRPCDCKANIAAGIMAARGSWGLPELIGVATAPTLDPRTNRIIDVDGFDQQTGLILILNDSSKWSGIPVEPKVGDVEKAIETLWLPFRDFPFDGPISRGVMLDAVLTTSVRPLLPTAPGKSFTAPTAGSGKSLLARCLSEIAGDTPAMLPNAGEAEEIRKRLLALLRENRRVMILDNVTGTLNSAALCVALTSPVYSDRILGVSETINVPTRTLLLITGNNITLKGDLCRRVLTCRIDPAMETPWKRRFDLDPAEYCRTHRLEMVAACLTIIRAGIQSGPTMPDRTASFELWSDTVRRSVCLVRDYDFLDVADPVESIDTAYDMDPETQKLSALFAAWWQVFQDEPVKVATLIKHGEWNSSSDLSTNPELNAVLHEIAGEGHSINPRRLGRWIEKNRERIISGLRVVPAGKSQGVCRWQLKKE